jgi:hypothetical protein
MKYRTMDDLCLSIRIFREYYKHSPKKDIEDFKDDFPELLDDTELSVVNELSEILREELEAGLTSERGRNIVRASNDAFGMTPLSRGDHFVYGILDLIQQHAQTIDNSKINGKIVEVALQVAKESHYSFLRCKAFELLAAMRTKFDVMPNQMVNTMLNGLPKDLQAKAKQQWKVIKRRVEDMQDFLTELRDKSAVRPPTPSFGISRPLEYEVAQVCILINSTYHRRPLQLP